MRKTRVWTGKKARHVITAAYRAAHRESEGRSLYRQAWNDRADEYIQENYRLKSASQIAEDLRKMFRRRMTKNMVISRYHRKLKNV